MSSIGTGYDLSSSQFNPEGKVFQIDYANKAVENSGTAIGIKCKDGVVMAVENIITCKLYAASERIFKIDSHIGMCVAGLLPDARHLVERARSECTTYQNTTGDKIPLEALVDRLAQYMHAYTLYSSVRPFGVSVMLASMLNGSSSLFVIDPSGLYYESIGNAIGKANQNAKTEIEKLDLENILCKDLMREAARIIYVVHDEVKDKNFELEMSVVGEITEGEHLLLSGTGLTDVEAYAKKALEDEDSDDGL